MIDSSLVAFIFLILLRDRHILTFPTIGRSLVSFCHFHPNKYVFTLSLLLLLNLNCTWLKTSAESLWKGNMSRKVNSKDCEGYRLIDKGHFGKQVLCRIKGQRRKMVKPCVGEEGKQLSISLDNTSSLHCVTVGLKTKQGYQQKLCCLLCLSSFRPPLD